MLISNCYDECSISVAGLRIQLGTSCVDTFSLDEINLEKIKSLWLTLVENLRLLLFGEFKDVLEIDVANLIHLANLIVKLIKFLEI